MVTRMDAALSVESNFGREAQPIADYARLRVRDANQESLKFTRRPRHFFFDTMGDGNFQRGCRYRTWTYGANIRYVLQPVDLSIYELVRDLGGSISAEPWHRYLSNVTGCIINREALVKSLQCGAIKTALGSQRYHEPRQRSTRRLD